ncbi:hypothetical protein Pcinc_041187, partial [Petrolisthes cinctipes]
SLPPTAAAAVGGAAGGGDELKADSAGREQHQHHPKQQEDKLGLLGSDQVSGESQQVSVVVSADLDTAATGYGGGKSNKASQG